MGAPAAALGGLTAYAFEAQGTQHVIYLGATDNHIRELWWDSAGRQTNDLTAATRAPAPANPAVFVGYVYRAEGTQHVDYVGADNHIHELWSNGPAWHTNDLTAAADAPPVGGDNLVGYDFAAEGTQHVDYVGADNRIHELWSNGPAWHTNDLTGATGAPAPLNNNSKFTGYAFEAQRTQHVNYVGTDNHIHELWSAS